MKQKKYIDAENAREVLEKARDGYDKTSACFYLCLWLLDEFEKLKTEDVAPVIREEDADPFVFGYIPVTKSVKEALELMIENIGCHVCPLHNNEDCSGDLCVAHVLAWMMDGGRAE